MYNEEIESVSSEIFENKMKVLILRIGEEEVHYVHDFICEYNISFAESLIADLVAEYKDEVDDVIDGDADFHVMAAVIHDEDSVSEKHPITSREICLHGKKTLIYVIANDLF